MLFETYPIPRNGNRIVNTDAVKSVMLPRVDLDQIEITDNPPLASRHYNLDMDAPPDLTGQASRSISIFGTTTPDPQTGARTICRISLIAKPWTADRPLPELPFAFPMHLENSEKAQDAFLREHATYYYEIQNDATLEPFGFAAKYGRMKVLPGSNYSLVYWSADTIKECNKLMNIGIYFTPPPLAGDEGDEAETFEVEQILIGGRMMSRKNLRIKFPYMWDELWADLKNRPARCLAWDESIGRMCVVHEGDSRISIIDFAQAPREGEGFLHSVFYCELIISLRHDGRAATCTCQALRQSPEIKYLPGQVFLQHKVIVISRFNSIIIVIVFRSYPTIQCIVSTSSLQAQNMIDVQVNYVDVHCGGGWKLRVIANQIMFNEEHEE